MVPAREQDYLLLLVIGFYMRNLILLGLITKEYATHLGFRA